MHKKIINQEDIHFYPFKKLIQASFLAYQAKQKEQLGLMIQESLSPKREIEIPMPLPIIPVPPGYEVRRKHVKIIEPLKETSYFVPVSDFLSEKITISKDSLNNFVYNIKESLPVNFIDEALKLAEGKYEDLDNIEKINKKLSEKLKLPFNKENTKLISYYIKRNTEGFGKITPLLNDDRISEIRCNGVDKPLLVKIRDKELNTNIIYTDNKELNNLIEIFAKKTNRVLSNDKPILDTILGTLRVQATLGNNFISSKFYIKKH